MLQALLPTNTINQTMQSRGQPQKQLHPSCTGVDSADCEEGGVCSVCAGEVGGGGSGL